MMRGEEERMGPRAREVDGTPPRGGCSLACTRTTPAGARDAGAGAGAPDGHRPPPAHPPPSPFPSPPGLRSRGGRAVLQRRGRGRGRRGPLHAPRDGGRRSGGAGARGSRCAAPTRRRGRRRRRSPEAGEEHALSSNRPREPERKSLARERSGDDGSNGAGGARTGSSKLVTSERALLYAPLPSVDSSIFGSRRGVVVRRA